MITNDATILRIKHEVNYQVAKLAWEGRLEEEDGSLPYVMIPGPQAQFRCCIYKEREIIKQRIRLAEGKTLHSNDSQNIIQVINAACEECPIASYVVTDNCRKCMGQACQNSCKFGAVSMGRHRAHIDATKCRECGKCSQACPYNAIAHVKRRVRWMPLRMMNMVYVGLMRKSAYVVVIAYIVVHLEQSAREHLSPRLLQIYLQEKK